MTKVLILSFAFLALVLVVYTASAMVCPIPGLESEFNGTPLTGTVPLTVYFVDMSGAPAVAYSWDFNNDSIIDATTMNAVYTYPSPSSYTVMHGVEGFYSSTCNETKTNYIVVTSPPVHFIDPSVIDFSNLSTLIGNVGRVFPGIIVLVVSIIPLYIIQGLLYLLIGLFGAVAVAFSRALQ